MNAAIWLQYGLNPHTAYLQGNLVREEDRWEKAVQHIQVPGQWALLRGPALARHQDMTVGLSTHPGYCPHQIADLVPAHVPPCLGVWAGGTADS